MAKCCLQENASWVTNKNGRVLSQEFQVANEMHKGERADNNNGKVRATGEQHKKH